MMNVKVNYCLNCSVGSLSRHVVLGSSLKLVFLSVPGMNRCLIIQKVSLAEQPVQ